MSTEVTSAEADRTVREASDLMQARGIRHLPVLEQGRAVGVITWSDINVLESVLQVDTDRMKIGEVMSKEVATAAPDDLLSEAAARMAAAHIGSLLVLEEGRLAGMFTATDAVRALASLDLSMRS